MTSFCNCNSGLSNLGKPTCATVGSVAKKLIYVPIRKADGTKNYIDSGDVIDEAYITALINQADPSERWYFSPFIENVEDTKGDSTLESLNNGSSIFVAEGARTFTGMYIKEGSTFLGKLKSGKCIDFGVYTVDIDGSLTGAVSTDGTKLYPIAVDKETFNPVLMKATDTTVEKVSVTFEFSRAERDENLRSINASDISVNLLEYDGLLDAYLASSSITATSVDITVTTSYGSFGNPIKIEGLVLADFALYNVTVDSAITPSLVTETTDGVYTITFPAATASDVVRVTLSKDGFDSTPITFVAV